MLEDVLFLTKNIFNETIYNTNKYNNAIIIYDVYRNLKELLDKLNFLSNHYLEVDFTEEYFKNLSYEDAMDKWRNLFNKNLEQLTLSTKKYLSSLNYLNPVFIDKHYRVIHYDAFVKLEYNVGFILPNSTILHKKTLKILEEKDKNYSIEEYKKIDLSILENRVNLKNDLDDVTLKLEYLSLKLKTYIKDSCTLDELLK